MSLTELVHFDKEGRVEESRPARALLRRLFLSLIIILVALLAFGIGRLTGQGREPVRIEYDQTISNSQFPISSSISNENSASGSVVASKNGTKYHYSYCPGAKQIKESNKITFNTAMAAEAAGYILASNCSPR